MPTLNSGQSATVTVPAGQSFRVATTSEATVSQTWVGGAIAPLDRIVGRSAEKTYPPNSGTQTYLVTCVSGVATYDSLYQYAPHIANFVLSSLTPVDGDGRPDGTVYIQIAP
jgi:hypothetical protein